MANPGELSINIVSAKQAEGANGLEPKGSVAGTRSPQFLVMGTTGYRWIERA